MVFIKAHGVTCLVDLAGMTSMTGAGPSLSSPMEYRTDQ
jgi:hypothetical protein